MMDNLKKFHDAVLKSIVFQWEIRMLELDLLPVGVGSSVIFRLEGVSKFSVPSEAPWGDSSSVNSIKCDSYGEKLRILVEVQSGDVIEIICEKFDFISSP